MAPLHRNHPKTTNHHDGLGDPSLLSLIFHCSTALPPFGQPYHAKIPCQTNWNSSHQHFYHLSTQIYIRLQDDPLRATTMNHAITAEQTTAEQLINQLESTNTGDSHKNDVANVIGKNRPSDLTFTITTPPAHDRNNSNSSNPDGQHKTITTMPTSAHLHSKLPPSFHHQCT